MAQYIDKAALVAEIQERIKKYATINVGGSKELDALYGAKCHALNSILSFLDTLEVKEVETPIIPKYSYFEHIYHCGSEPMWKIGDVLAVYEFYSDREGEHVYGEVIDVKMDEDYSDWVYTIKGDFGGYEDICENTLISEQAYKKNK